MSSNNNSEQKKSALVPVALVILGLLVVAGVWFALKPASDRPVIGEASSSASLETDMGTTMPPSPEPVSNDLKQQSETQSALDKAAELTAADNQKEKDIAVAQAAKPVPKVQAEGRFLGKSDAPVKIIEFSSLTCSHCAHFHNTILDEFRVKYVDTGLVQIEFREFPLNKQAFDATKLLHCLPKEQYFPFSTILFQTQNSWAFTSDYLVPLKQTAKLAGLSDKEFDACLNDKTKEKAIVAELQKDVEKYKLESTPTFIINEGVARVSGALPVSEFAKIIDPLLPAAKTTEAAPAPTPSTETTSEKPAP